jgi:hypothetical protein
MTHRPEIAHIAAAGGFVDNASALPTTPPAPPPHESRTFDSSSKADIFTRHRQRGEGHVLGAREMSGFCSA